MTPKTAIFFPALAGSTKIKCGLRWRQRWQSGDDPRKGGLSAKIHLAVDSHGMPVRVIVTEGATPDCSQTIPLIDDIKAEYLLAGRAYDPDAIAVFYYGLKSSGYTV